MLKNTLLSATVEFQRDRGRSQQSKVQDKQANRKLHRHTKVQPQFGSYPLYLAICFCDLRHLR